MKKLLFSILGAVLLLSACSKTTKAEIPMVTINDLQGSWFVESIGQKPVTDLSLASITFNKDGKVSGNSSCNRLMSSYQLNQANKGGNSKLQFSQVAGTMMMCSETLMEQEQRFLTALTKVTQVSIENNLLILTDENRQVLLEASKK